LEGSWPPYRQASSCGINFDPGGKISGSYTVDETDTVAKEGKTYKGTFDFKAYDASGNLAAEVEGTTPGTRITVR
jgi:hypothetical protein